MTHYMFATSSANIVHLRRITMFYNEPCVITCSVISMEKQLQRKWEEFKCLISQRIRWDLYYHLLFICSNVCEHYGPINTLKIIHQAITENLYWCCWWKREWLRLHFI